MTKTPNLATAVRLSLMAACLASAALVGCSSSSGGCDPMAGDWVSDETSDRSGADLTLKAAESGMYVGKLQIWWMARNGKGEVVRQNSPITLAGSCANKVLTVTGMQTGPKSVLINEGKLVFPGIGTFHRAK